MTEEEEENSISRRSVVKSLGAGAATLTGVSAATGLGAASGGEHGDANGVEEVFAAHEDGLLTTLAEDGLLEGASVSALETGRVSPAAVARDEEGTALLTPSTKGIEEPTLHSVKRTDEGVLTVIVRLKSGKAHAVFSPADAETAQLYSEQQSGDDSAATTVSTAESTSGEVTPAATCTDEVCNLSKTKTIRVDKLCGFGECVPITSCNCAA